MAPERTALTVVPTLAALLFSSFSGCFLLEQGRHPAYDFVTSDPYDQLAIEIDYVQGYGAHTDARDLLRTRALGLLDKPGGIEFDTQAVDAILGGRATWTEDDLADVEDQFRDRRNSGNTSTLYVLYVNGHSARDTDTTRVLGVRYGASSIAIFKESILGDTPTSQLFGAREIERSVLVHEFGHAIGLVDCGIPMTNDRLDRGPDGGSCHSTNQASVMYHAIETSDIFAFLSPPPNDFDGDDRADVRAAGGKA